MKCAWESISTPTTRIEHAEVLPGSWEARVSKGLIADSNSALLFAVAQLGDKMDSFMIQTLCEDEKKHRHMTLPRSNDRYVVCKLFVLTSLYKQQILTKWGWFGLV